MHQPVFSIVIPTYNRPDRLARFLASLTTQDYPRAGFELVLVDDGSDVPLEPVVERFRDRLDIRFIRAQHGGVARSRQAGCEAARGRYLAFTDDDCEPAPDWLRQLEAVLTASPHCAAGGRTVNALKRNPYSEASQLLIGYLYQVLNCDPLQARFFTGNNMAMPAELYHAVGGLDVTWPFCGEDRDLCARWKDRGYAMVYVPAAVVFHSHDLTFRKFWRQHFNYGRGAFRFHATAALRRGQGDTLERLPFYFRLLLYPFSQLGFCAAVRALLLLFVAQSANAAGYWRERRNPTDPRTRKP